MADQLAQIAKTFRTCAPLAVQKAGDGKPAGYFEGWGAVFGNVDYGGDIIVPGAFTDTLAEWAARKELPAMCWSHDHSNPIGEWVEMRQEAQGLWVAGMLWIDGEHPDQDALKAYRQMKGTGPKGLSMGGGVVDASYETRDEKTIRMLKTLQLWEVSPCLFGMNTLATVTDVKARELGDDPAYAAKLREIADTMSVLTVSAQMHSVARTLSH